jgi:hypothetical protein
MKAATIKTIMAKKQASAKNAAFLCKWAGSLCKYVSK